MSGKVIKVAGPLVVAEGLEDANVSDVVRVGPQHLIGEILNMTGDRASIQVYEETTGLGPGAEVSEIYDGVFADPQEFNKKVHYLFMGMGTEENMGSKRISQMLNDHGIKCTYYESQGTAHEWLTWRRCLAEFVPHLFK